MRQMMRTRPSVTGSAALRAATSTRNSRHSLGTVPATTPPPVRFAARRPRPQRTAPVRVIATRWYGRRRLMPPDMAGVPGPAQCHGSREREAPYVVLQL